MSKIELKAEAWIDNGEWRLLLRGPRWVLVDIVDRMGASRTLDQANGPTLISGQSKTDQQSSIMMVTCKDEQGTFEDVQD